jgi:UDP-2-acetamido-3-amino-2,3-dideoxy-glucuronate N-acetyltransferase
MRKTFIHPTAIVDEGAQIGLGSKVWHWVHISAGAQIGEDCVFGQNVFVGNRVVLGRNVRVQNNVSIYDDVTLEDDVFCGPSMVFTNVINPRSAVSRKDEYKKTHVKRGASLGANCTIVCGVTIGEFAFVGAGAVVTKDVPAYALVAGVPAKQIGWLGEFGERLISDDGFHWNCPATKSRYLLKDAVMTREDAQEMSV